MDIKNGKTLEDVKTKYGFYSDEEFFSALEWLTTPTNVRLFKRQFEQNERKAIRHGVKKATASEPESTEVTTQHTTLVPTIMKEDNKSMLESLFEQEERLSKECVTLEGKHKKSEGRRDDIAKERADLTAGLKKLKTQVESIIARINSLEEENLSLAAEMTEYSAQLSVVREKLQKVRDDIEEARKVTILVYEDGTIDIENGTIPEPDIRDVNDCLTRIFNTENAEGVTVKWVKLCAYLLVATRGLESFEIAFDDDKAQAFWESIN